MREPYGKAVATRAGPEPWRCGGDAVTQASVGVRVGWVWSRERMHPGRRGASPSPKTLPPASLARDADGPRAVVDPMHARKLSAQELGGPAGGRDEDGVAVRAVNPTGARRR
jgi:hypothetical protein